MLGGGARRPDDKEAAMIGTWLCRVGMHHWERRTATGASGNPKYLACSRCNKERYTPGPEQTRGMTGIGG